MNSASGIPSKSICKSRFRRCGNNLRSSKGCSTMKNALVDSQATVLIKAQQATNNLFPRLLMSRAYNTLNLQLGVELLATQLTINDDAHASPTGIPVSI